MSGFFRAFGEQLILRIWLSPCRGALPERCGRAIWALGVGAEGIVAPGGAWYTFLWVGEGLRLTASGCPGRLVGYHPGLG
jgi:hypothetical protein